MQGKKKFTICQTLSCKCPCIFPDFSFRHSCCSIPSITAIPYMEITVTASNELCYTARCKQLTKMTSRSDIHKRFQSLKIILKFTEASGTKLQNINASNLTLLRQYQTVLKWTQSPQSSCMNPNGKHQQATNLTLSYFMQDSPKRAFTYESLHKGTVTTNRSNQHNLLPYKFCKVLSLLINPYNHDDHLGKSILS